jgi:hypothetical protein
LGFQIRNALLFHFRTGRARRLCIPIYQRGRAMRTSSFIFAILFVQLAFYAGQAAFNGATHQWFTSGICMVMALVLLADANKKISPLK